MGVRLSGAALDAAERASEHECAEFANMDKKKKEVRRGEGGGGGG